MTKKLILEESPNKDGYYRFKNKFRELLKMDITGFIALSTNTGTSFGETKYVYNNYSLEFDGTYPFPLWKLYKLEPKSKLRYMYIPIAFLIFFTIILIGIRILEERFSVSEMTGTNDISVLVEKDKIILTIKEPTNSTNSMKENTNVHKEDALDRVLKMLEGY